MAHRIILAGLVTAATLTFTEFAEAGHCCCTSGYSISAPVTTVYRGVTTYSSRPATVYYYSPSSYYYRSYSPYGYYQPYGRSGISISIGSGYPSGYGFGPSYQPFYGYSRFGYGPSFPYSSRYGIGSRSGFSIGIGSSIGRHYHHHH